MAKCVVFGATGFIGQNLVEQLIDKGHEVVAFSRTALRYPLSSAPLLTDIQADFLNAMDIERAVTGSDYVFHFISLTNPAISDANPYIDIDTNVKMSIVLFDACVKYKVKRVIYASSGGSVYGDSKEMFYKETDCIYPVSPYAIGKSTVENYLRYYKVKHGLDYVVLRIANVYGEGQDDKSGKHGIVAVFINAVTDGKPLNIYGDGSMIRDYIYVKDLVKLIARIFEFNQLKHSIYNVGSSEGKTILDVIQAVETVTDKKAQSISVEAPNSFVERVVLDCSRAKIEFGEFVETSFEDGVNASWQFLKAKDSLKQ